MIISVSKSDCQMNHLRRRHGAALLSRRRRRALSRLAVAVDGDGDRPTNSPWKTTRSPNGKPQCANVTPPSYASTADSIRNATHTTADPLTLWVYRSGSSSTCRCRRKILVTQGTGSNGLHRIICASSRRPGRGGSAKRDRAVRQLWPVPRVGSGHAGPGDGHHTSHAESSGPHRLVSVGGEDRHRMACGDRHRGDRRGGPAGGRVSRRSISRRRSSRTPRAAR